MLSEDKVETARAVLQVSECLVAVLEHHYKGLQPRGNSSAVVYRSVNTHSTALTHTYPQLHTQFAYYWYNFMPLARGTAAVGYSTVLTLFWAAGMPVTAYIPKDYQVSAFCAVRLWFWEPAAVLRPDWQLHILCVCCRAESAEAVPSTAL